MSGIAGELNGVDATASRGFANLRRFAARVVVGALLALPGIGNAAEEQPAAPPQPAGGEAPWPRIIKSGSSTLTVYQPQVDAWDGHSLSARVAVQVASGDDPPHTSYGVATLEARTLTDKGQRLVTIDQVKVTASEFPSADAAKKQEWANAIARGFVGKSRTVALDRLEAQMDTGKAKANGELKNTPPHILFSQSSALLVYVDGEAAYRAMEGTAYERVINTRPLLLRDKQGVHYLKVFDGWMSAPSLPAQWQVLTKPSPALDEAFKKATAARTVDPLTGQSTPDQPAPSLKKTVPAIYVVTTPTELVVTDGPPSYKPIAGTQLLYVSNTTGRVFKHIADNTTWVLATGRWFRAASEDGPWEFVAADKLPEDFAKIPDDSPVENVKASVAGTPQAREAAIAASVPQTAAVKISGTKLTPPVFDGAPVFKPIAGTPLEYAANTATPMVRVDKTYYAVENAVWFVGTSAQGPWVVARSVPASIYTIPPESPLHYVTYVRIYSVVGDVVYEGYTPGYQGTMVDPATSVVVYGTGYSYSPWVGTVWYGPPVTYGFGASVVYTPWTGWGVSYGFGWAWGTTTVIVGWGWGPYPWWGPWGWGWAWGPPVYPWYPAWGGVAHGAGGGAVAWGPGGWAGYSGNIYQNWGNRATVSRVAGGYNAWTGNRWATQVGSSYNSRTGVSAAGQRGAVHNVYTGNYATGARGAATGPGGDVVVGARGTIGNTETGDQISGSRGAYYDKETGQWTTFGGATGQDGGHVARVGDDIYAGKDGNVYRRTDSGWEQHGSDGWESVAGSGQVAATREATGGLGAAHTNLPDRDFQARQAGAERAQGFNQSSASMKSNFGGRAGGRVGGGGRRR